MSTKTRERSGSFTSTRSAKRPTGKMTEKQPQPVVESLVSLEVLPSNRSISPLTKRLESEAFRLAWENDIGLQVAKNLLMLRKYRECSQALVASGAATSQGKIARIEAGQENITLQTLRKLIAALNGRLQISISPAELSFPRMMPWWECVHHGAASKHSFQMRRFHIEDNGELCGVAGLWTAPSLEPSHGATELTGLRSSGKHEAVFLAVANE
jgi:transcriptional regulator with XRE-family HTH domain